MRQPSSRAWLWAGPIQRTTSLSSEATSVNLGGQVVGDYSDGVDHRAFVWQLGTVYDLNSLIPRCSGWKLRGATSISDNGLIVGTGEYKGDRTDHSSLYP